jgi:N utilization substance protein B
VADEQEPRGVADDQEPRGAADEQQPDDGSDWGHDADPRSDARERAFNVLFESDVRGCTPHETITRIQVPFDELTMLLIEGVATQQTRIDELLASHSHSWTLDRMLATDRNVLRLGTFELLVRSEVPTAVILNEAVRLAKRFGSDDSGRFVNGVLAAVARVVRAGETFPANQGSAD